MDAARFDRLTCILSLGVSRRRLVPGLTSGLLAALLLGRLHADSDARKKRNKKPCPPCAKRRHGRCKKSLADGTPCPTGTCQAGACVSPPVPPAPTCAAPNGLKDGTETGVDCGGACPRCGLGKGCASAHDCLSAFCANGVCQECAPNQCGSDSNGPCICQNATGSGQLVCHTAKGQANSACTCPPGTRCFFYPGQNGCFAPCGAA
jgi:hypothetical protein